MYDMLRSQEFNCAVTGAPLRLPTKGRDPWSPSVDQIRPGGGYTRENTRIVAMIVNFAMGEWGPEPMMRLAGYLSRREK